jgi:hypothetical protein
MISGKVQPIEYIIEQLHEEYGFQSVDKTSVSEYIWKAVGLIGILDPLKDVQDYVVTIAENRGLLPHDLYQLSGVREYTTGTMMTEVTDLFFLSSNEYMSTETEVATDTNPATGEEFYTVVFDDNYPELYRYKTQGNYIYTAFTTGRVELSYKAFPVDIESGLPTLPDDVKYLRAVTSYCAERMAFKMMMQDLLSERKYEIIRQDYLFNVGSAKGAGLMPDASRMQTLANRWKAPHPYMEHFYSGFKYSGSKRNY